MHLKIGKSTNKANVKVRGGFIAEMPIAFLSSYNVVLGEEKRVSVVVNYYRSFIDFENGEEAINDQPKAGNLTPENTDKRLYSNIQNLLLIGDSTEANVYEALRLKLVEEFTDVELINN